MKKVDIGSDDITGSNIQAVQDLPEEPPIIDSELTPIKRNILRIIAALIIGFLLGGTVAVTDYVMDFIKHLF